MVINGREIAEEIVGELEQGVDDLKSRGKIPKIAIVTLGDEGAWKAYVGQKLKLADRLKIEKEFVTLESPTQQELLDLIQKLDSNKTIDGIIVQRPFPPEFHIDKEKVVNAVTSEKDIDGFRVDSPYEVPTWQATKKILPG